MSTDPQQERTLGQLVASASADLSALVRGEIALAKAEVGKQVKKAGVGAAFLAVAGVIGFYSVYFIFTTIAEGIQALGLSRWLSFLIVTVFMLLVAAVFALLGIRKMKTVEPTPEKTIETARATVADLKAAVSNPGTVTPAARPVVQGPPQPAPRGQTSPTPSASASATSPSSPSTPTPAGAAPDATRDA
ncbi:MAG: phage holin family protein [Humibacillus sp.]|nr:phage holin family protein [Humibacillus sp.]MDN5779007.1 phage holin family protein [Humibacillus sp.]